MYWYTKKLLMAAICSIIMGGVFMFVTCNQINVSLLAALITYWGMIITGLLEHLIQGDVE